MEINKKASHFCEAFCDPAGIRTQDHYIKSVMLYQLSYGIIIEVAKIEIFYKKQQAFKQTHPLLSKTTDSQ